MDKEDMMSVSAEHQTMWTLSADRKTVRLAVPPAAIRRCFRTIGT
jgi:hypothetical protein